MDLSYLNKEQKEAVQTTQGAVLVLAGAGTGKTRVLTSRLAYIVSSGLCSIDEVLAVTFTNKAAKEMRERSVSLLGSIPSNHSYNTSLWIGTFHSLALRIIRPLHEKFNRTSNFSIIDGDDQIRIIKKISSELGIDDKKYQPRSMAYYINRWKDSCKSVDDAFKMSARYTSEEVAAKIYKFYEETLTSLDAIDFGDILKYSIDIFKYNEDILDFWQSKFKYIMVDEYQDTNAAQYIWLRLLSMKHKNICCVGDDDQSIYSWRGADVENILRFEKDFKNTTIINLAQNYRSTKNIIAAAKGLISNNAVRMEKDFWTEKSSGLPIIVKSLYDQYEEAMFISSLIDNKAKNEISFKEIAILVRAAFQTRAFEERFLAMGIPYTVVGGIRFYERKEIKDAIAYLKLVVNKDDTISFERIVNLPRRGIGPTTLNKFYQISKEQNISIPKAAESMNLPKLKDFFTQLQIWRNDLGILPISELMAKILKESGYRQMIKDSKLLEDEARLETLEELLNALKEFENTQDFLDYISLVLDNSGSASSDKVTISTIHAAKGLEYDTVFIPGFEENILPHQKSVAEKGQIGVEEERRLCYVAITRAKKEAYLTMCKKRVMYGSYGSSDSYAKPSRFLQDFPKGIVKII